MRSLHLSANLRWPFLFQLAEQGNVLVMVAWRMRRVTVVELLSCGADDGGSDDCDLEEGGGSCISHGFDLSQLT